MRRSQVKNLSELEALLQRARESSFGELSSDEVRQRVNAFLNSQDADGDDDGDDYYGPSEYVTEVFPSFVITSDFRVDGFYQKRDYDYSRGTLTIGAPAPVERSWIPALRATRSQETQVPAKAPAAARGEVTPEVLRAHEAAVAACDAPIQRVKETTLSFREAVFAPIEGDAKFGVIENVAPIKACESANGKQYPAEMLRRDMAVFEGMPVFLDHQDPSNPKPLRNVVGVLENVRWDAREACPRADLRYPRSMEAVIEEVHQKYELLGPERVGMSIDMNVKARISQAAGRTVHVVEALLGGVDASTDIVFNPAAEGRVWESINPDTQERPDMTLAELKAKFPELAAQMAREALDAEAAKAAEAEATRATEAAKAEAPSFLTAAEAAQIAAQAAREAVAQDRERSRLELRIREAKLSDRVAQSILREAEDAKFEAQAVEGIFEGWLNDAAAAQGGQYVKVPGMSDRVQVTEAFDLNKARLLGSCLKEDQEFNGQRVRRFTSLREAVLAFEGGRRPELYRMSIDDRSEFARECVRSLHWGGGDLNRVMESRSRESIQVASFSTAWADVMHRALLAALADPESNTWRPWISDITRFDDLTNTKKFIRLGDYPNLDLVGEGSPYLPIQTFGQQQVAFSINKYGNTEDYTWEAALRDDLGVLTQIPTKLGAAWAWTVHDFIYSLLCTGAGVGQLMDYDGVALYNAAHNNIGSTAIGGSAIIAAEDRFRQQTDFSSNRRKSFKGKYLLYNNNVALRQLIWEALQSDYKVNPLDGNNSQTMLPNFIKTYLGLEAIEVNYPTINGYTPTTRWELVSDPRRCDTMIVGFLNGQEQPEIFVQDMENVGSVFNTDKITFKIKGTVGADVADHRAFSRGNA